MDAIQGQQIAQEKVLLPIVGTEKMVAGEQQVMEDLQVISVDELPVPEIGDFPPMNKHVLEDKRYIEVRDEDGVELLEHRKLAQDIPLKQDDPAPLADLFDEPVITDRIADDREGEIFKKRIAFSDRGIIGNSQDDAEFLGENAGEFPGADSGAGHFFAHDIFADHKDVIAFGWLDARLDHDPLFYLNGF